MRRQVTHSRGVGQYAKESTGSGANPAVERLLARFIDESAALPGCWEWDGPRNRAGYGVVSVSGKNQMVHRAVFTLLNGPIAPGKIIRHRCDNPPCFRPEHLTGRYSFRELS